MKEESDVPRLVRAENGGIGKDIPDAVIMNRFRNIISCSSKLPPVGNERRVFFRTPVLELVFFIFFYPSVPSSGTAANVPI